MKATTILRAFDIASCRYADLRAYQRHYGTCDAREMWRTLQVIAACKQRLQKIASEYDALKAEPTYTKRTGAWPIHRMDGVRASWTSAGGPLVETWDLEGPRK